MELMFVNVKNIASPFLVLSVSEEKAPSANSKTQWLECGLISPQTCQES